MTEKQWGGAIELFGKKSYIIYVEITKIPNKILAKKTEKVAIKEIKNGSYKELILDMKKSMKENVGIGLAANQINKDLSIFIIDEKLASENNASDVFSTPKSPSTPKIRTSWKRGVFPFPDTEQISNAQRKLK